MSYIPGRLALGCWATCLQLAPDQGMDTLKIIMDKMMVELQMQEKSGTVKNNPWLVPWKALLSHRHQTDQDPWPWKGCVICNVDQSFKDFLANRIPENTALQ